MSITCKQATDFISKKEERKITLLQRYQLWRHFAVCSLCKLFYKQNKLLVSSLKQTSAYEETLANEEKAAMIKMLEQDKGTTD